MPELVSSPTAASTIAATSSAAVTPEPTTVGTAIRTSVAAVGTSAITVVSTVPDIACAPSTSSLREWSAVGEQEEHREYEEQCQHQDDPARYLQIRESANKHPSADQGDQ